MRLLFLFVTDGHIEDEIVFVGELQTRNHGIVAVSLHADNRGQSGCGAVQVDILCHDACINAANRRIIYGFCRIIRIIACKVLRDKQFHRGDL